MKPYTLISVDGHAGLPTAQYRDYLERKYHAAFDDEIEQLAALRKGFLNAGKNATKTPLMYEAHMHRYSDPDNHEMQERIRGAWDLDVRLRELDAEGVIGEVLFPDGQGFNSFPFGGFFGEHPVPIRDPELRAAGEWVRSHPEQVPADARIMTWFPWEVRVTSNRTTVLMPRNYQRERIVEVMKQYGVTHLLWGSFEPPEHVDPQVWGPYLDRLKIGLGLTDSQELHRSPDQPGLFYPVRLYRVR